MHAFPGLLQHTLHAHLKVLLKTIVQRIYTWLNLNNLATTSEMTHAHSDFRVPITQHPGGDNLGSRVGP